MKPTEITTHEIACQVLERDPTALPDVSMLPENQKEVITTIKKLIDIAEAINKLDNDFKPDWTDFDQYKWRPWFDGSRGFAFVYSRYADWYTRTSVGSRLCFRTETLSDFFGKQFEDLHKKTLTQ